jgi:long-chain acyl-CoA synthetase
MSSESVARYDDIIAQLTAAGEFFELTTCTTPRGTLPCYRRQPQNLRAYYDIMLRRADREFLVYGPQRYTFGETYAHAAALAGRLVRDYGVRPGDRVAIAARNSPQWIFAFIAATAIGAVATPLNAWWRSREMGWALKDCEPALLVVDRACQRSIRRSDVDPLPPLVGIGDERGTLDGCTDLMQLARPAGEEGFPALDVPADAPCCLLYTSGSTGTARGVLSSQRSVLVAIYSWLLMGVARKRFEGGDGSGAPAAGLLTIPLFHCTGSHSAFLLSIVAGRKLVLMPRWDVDHALRLIEEERITWFTGVPGMSAELAAAVASSDADTSSLTEVFAGGAARPPAQVRAIDASVATAAPGIGYGLTESNALGAANFGAWYRERPGSTGRVVPAVSRIAAFDGNGRQLPSGEQGELCLRSAACMDAYWRQTEATSGAFYGEWLRTGDVGYVDADGFVYIVDRLKQIIIRGGENISTLEVEAAIHEHPGVRETAVFAVPDERLGEAVACVIVPRPGAHLDGESMRAFLHERLAAFKVPAHVQVRSAPLPRTGSGKTDKRSLQRAFADT